MNPYLLVFQMKVINIPDNAGNPPHQLDVDDLPDDLQPLLTFLASKQVPVRYYLQIAVCIPFPSQ